MGGGSAWIPGGEQGALLGWGKAPRCFPGQVLLCGLQEDELAGAPALQEPPLVPSWGPIEASCVLG